MSHRPILRYPKPPLLHVAIRRLPGGCVLLTNGSQLFSFFAHKNLLGFVVWENHPPVVTQISLTLQSKHVKAMLLSIRIQLQIMTSKRSQLNANAKFVRARAAQGCPLVTRKVAERLEKTTFGSVLNKEIPLIYPINPNNTKILWSFSWKHDNKPSNFGVSYFQTDPCGLSCTTQLCAQKRGRKASKAQNESRPNEQQLHVSPQKNVKPQKNSTTTCHKCHGQMHSFKRPALKRFQDPAWPRSARLEHSINWLKEVWLICAIWFVTCWYGKQPVLHHGL